MAFMLRFSWQSNLGFAAIAFGVPGKCILERLPAQVKRLFPKRSMSIAQLLKGQDLPLCVASRSQESSMAAGERDNSSGSFLRLAGGLG